MPIFANASDWSLVFGSGQGSISNGKQKRNLHAVRQCQTLIAPSGRETCQGPCSVQPLTPSTDPLHLRLSSHQECPRELFQRTPEGSALGSTLDNLKFFFFLSVKENLSSNLQKVWSEASVCRPGAVASAQTLSYVCCTSQRRLLIHKSVLLS